MKKPYNGYESWSAWNVSLWIGNDEPLYLFAMDCLRRGKGSVARATTLFLQSYQGEKTPDGARFSRRSVYLALQGLAE